MILVSFFYPTFAFYDLVGERIGISLGVADIPVIISLNLAAELAFFPRENCKQRSLLSEIHPFVEDRPYNSLRSFKFFLPQLGYL
ncbi:MAG: hypothetical protein SAL07_13245 [Oscillatoria sp. PMC 1051.18]|nr:hypothetical protein [Oscillatoria sp. PMC 1050.18]MEC5030858.1 hypothetical protein [Oscillatoria sp. PMC 1051.18]